jgi:hypothetical protein
MVMPYLDLSPMLRAMRERPSEFEMHGTYLRHIPSHHLLSFDIWGNARVHARCDCAMLDVSRAQSEEVRAALAGWKIVYWEPHLAQVEAERHAERINREFALHFRPGMWQRFVAMFGRKARNLPSLAIEPDVEIAERDARPPERTVANREGAMAGR